MLFQHHRINIWNDHNNVRKFQVMQIVENGWCYFLNNRNKCIVTWHYQNNGSCCLSNLWYSHSNIYWMSVPSVQHKLCINISGERQQALWSLFYFDDALTFIKILYKILSGNLSIIIFDSHADSKNIWPNVCLV